MNEQEAPGFFEFFAGGGMVRAGLGSSWSCLFANDFDEKKAESYRANWGSEALVVDDVANLKVSEIPIKRILRGLRFLAKTFPSPVSLRDWRESDPALSGPFGS